MKKKLMEKLNNEFPNVFYHEINGSDAFSMFYFEIGDGWYDLIYETAKVLEPLFIKQIKKDPEGYSFGYYRTSQIKEKYGTLRWYISGGTDAIDDIISKAEKVSAKICEQCGKPGKLRGKGWFYTACVKHTKREDLTNLEFLAKKYNEKDK